MDNQEQETRNATSLKSYYKHQEEINLRRRAAYAKNPKVRKKYVPNTPEQQAYLKAYREKNAERLRQKDRERYQNDKELFRQRQREKRLRYLEEVKLGT